MQVERLLAFPPRASLDADGAVSIAAQAGEAFRSRESIFQQARTSTSSAAAGANKASGDCMAHKVAPLIAHQSIGTTRSSQRVRSAAMSTPSVATTVGSGAMPKGLQPRPTEQPADQRPREQRKDKDAKPDCAGHVPARA